MTFVSLGVSAPQLWAALSAPFGATFVVRSGFAARFEGIALMTAPTARPVQLGVVALTAATLLSVALLSTSGLDAWCQGLFFAVLAYLAIIDLRFLVVPVRLCLAVVAVGIFYAAVIGGARTGVEAALVAGLSWAVLQSIALIYRAVRGRDGLGSGDALVAAALGAWTPAVDIAWSVATGCLATLALVLAARRAHSAQAFPLAPGLASGAAAVFIFRRLQGGS